jgi:hypothetical protein
MFVLIGVVVLYKMNSETKKPKKAIIYYLPSTRIIDSLALNLIWAKYGQDFIFNGRSTTVNKTDSTFNFECVVENRFGKMSSRVELKYLGGTFNYLQNYQINKVELVDNFKD